MFQKIVMLSVIFLIANITACAEKSNTPNQSKKSAEIKLDEGGCPNQNIDRIALFSRIQ